MPEPDHECVLCGAVPARFVMLVGHWLCDRCAEPVRRPEQSRGT
jgi:hypothetical protein